MEYTKETFETLEKFLSDRYTQQLNGLSYKIVNSCGRSVNELIIALTMDKPDIDIALGMAGRIRQELDKLKIK